MNYTPIYIKTENSLLESLIKIQDLISCAKKYGFQALAIADSNMFGVMEFYRACIQNNIKPIIGLEVSYENQKIVLYAKNYEGYQSLIKLSTISSKETLKIENFHQYASQLICILPFSSRNLYSSFHKIYEDIYLGYETEEEYKEIRQFKTMYVKEILCLNKEDSVFLEYLEAIKKGILKEDVVTSYTNVYLKSMEEYLKLDYCPQNNIEFAKKIDIVIPKREGLLPIYDTGGIDTNLYLKNMCKEGLKKRFGARVPKIYIERLKYELSVIEKMGFSNYFLVVCDYVNYAKKNGILVGPGRGSAAGSLVSFVLNITDIDPIQYHLLFERFLNPERVTMPDIDIDFLDSRREEVIAYCIQKYGLKRASGIITFGTLAAKQAVRDVFRVLDIESDTVSKMIDSKLTLIENIKNNQKLKSYLEEHKKQKEGYLVAMKLEGLKRHTSIHAAGMVISSVDLDEVVPLYYHDNMYLTAYSMNYLEDLGLLKMDFLGLKNLNIIDRVLKDLRNDHIDLSFDTIPLNDKEALHVFYDVNTIGIFQFESEGMMNFLRKFKPRTFEDIYACLALYRPGPMGNIDIYIRRKEGKEKVNYYHPSLEPILKPTYGILIYQEQIMQVANVMASYSLGEADILRRAMSKKKEEVLLKEKDKFMSRAIQNGYEEKIALEVYELILKFASYGFNKAHSVAYAMISYKMAYLKAHYPAYFIRGLLDMSIGSSASTKDYIYEAKKNHLEILGPDINLSDKHYTIYNNQIRYPLYNIKNVGIQASELILEERKKGPFKDIYDFVKRTYSKTMNTGTLTSLILAGCFDSFHINRKTLITNLDLILNYAEVITYLDEEYALKPVLEEVEEYDKKTIMNQELEVFGFYLSTHPVLELREKYQKKISTKDLKNYFDKNIEMIVSIKRLKEIETKKQEKMGFLTCEDEADVLDVVLFPKIYQSLHCKQDDMILLKGHVEKRFDKLQVVASSIQKLEE